MDGGNAIIQELARNAEEALARLRELRETPLDQYLVDWRVQDLVERELQKLLQACIDMGNRLISLRSLPVPAGYHEMLEVLAQAGILPTAVAQRMHEWIGLRNVLVHEYFRTDPRRVYGHLHDSLDLFPEYIRFVLNSVS